MAWTSASTMASLRAGRSVRCGWKSTLLRMVAGLERSSGTVAVGERAVNELPPKERDVAMVFQNYALYPHMTVRDNMGFSLMLAKRPSAEIAERVNQGGGDSWPDAIS